VALASAGASIGFEGFVSSGLGWLTGLALFLPFFVIGGMGAGDVKLLAAFGAWLGPSGAMAAAFWAVLLGGALGVVIGLLHGYLGQAVRNLWAAFITWRIYGLSAIPGMTLRDSAGPRLAYAIPIAAGALVALWRAQ
jgi:prepilin peptidase CpaA